MESTINIYRLNQGNKEFIFKTSIIGNKLKMACKNSSNENNIEYVQEFTIEQLKQIDEIFNNLNSPYEASDFIDQALSNQKVRVSEDINQINIRFIITINNVTHQIDIPLYESSFNESNVNQNVSNADTNNFTGNEASNQNSSQLLNSAFSQNNQSNQYYSQMGNYSGNYGQDSNMYNYNQFNEKLPVIGPVDDSTEQYYQSSYQQDNTMQSTQNYDTNQFYQNYQANEITNNQYINQTQVDETKPFITPVENEENEAKINEQINQFLHNANGTIEQTGTDNNKEIDLNTLTRTKVLPIQTTSRVLPVLGPFTNLEGVDFYQLANMNALKNSNIAFQPVQNVQAQNYYQQQNIQTSTTVDNNTNVNAAENVNKTSNDNNENKNVNVKVNDNVKANANKNARNISKKKPISAKKAKKAESDEIKMLRSQLAELEPLRKKVAEMEVLRSQLTELNSLRTQVAEYKAKEEQFKNIDNLRSQVDKLSLENEKLKIRIEELEDIKSKNDEEINSLKETVKMFSKQSGLNNNMKNIMENNMGNSRGNNMENQMESNMGNSRGNSMENHMENNMRNNMENNMENDGDNKDIVNEDNSQDMSVKGDIIHDTSELDLLTQKINKLNQKLTLNLLYKATADSDKAAAFHAKCDDAQSTIVLVETDKGKRFGGYTTCSWGGDCIEKRDENAFIFSLDKMVTYDNIPGEDAIGCYPKYGPVFLGCQIRIFDNAFTRGGTTFEKGLNYETEEDFELSGGDRCFNVKEIEVYEVIKE